MLVAKEPEEQGDVEEQGNEEEHGTDDTTAEEPETAVLEDTVDDQPIPSPASLTLPLQQPQDADIYHIDMDHAAKVLSMQEDESEVQEAVEVVTTAKFIIEVVAAVSEIVSTAAIIPSTVLEIISAAVIPTVTAPSIKVAALVKAAVPSARRKKGVVIRDPEEESSAKFNANLEFLLKSKEQIEEAKEAESIKQHLQIVPDEDDDVFTKATPLAKKVPVVDYQVILVNNKP
nr:hypothetical protein [Tanacetum cinerariifolium]